VFNLGHGVLPNTNPEVLSHIVDLVHNHDSIPSGERG
jgi:uroporphyrinogen-III decarboxylase